MIGRFFSAEEQAQWKRVDREGQLLAFYHGWTRKEAWLKALGSGLAFPLADFSVSLDPDLPPRLLSIRGDTGEAAAWWLDSCVPTPDYLAAVAIQGKPPRIQRWRCH